MGLHIYYNVDLRSLYVTRLANFRATPWCTPYRTVLGYAVVHTVLAVIAPVSAN